MTCIEWHTREIGVDNIFISLLLVCPFSSSNNSQSAANKGNSLITTAYSLRTGVLVCSKNYYHHEIIKVKSDMSSRISYEFQNIKMKEYDGIRQCSPGESLWHSVETRPKFEGPNLRKMPNKNVKNTSTKNVSTGVLDKNKEHHLRWKDKAKKNHMIY